MKFRTTIEMPDYPFRINYGNRLIFIGSCFSDHIGGFFQENGFNACSNPYGVLFNPSSIALALRLAMNPDQFGELYEYQHQDLWVSFAHHGKFSHPDQEVFRDNIKSQLHETGEFLKKADYLFITFGTAYYYKFKTRDLIVANCHKIPGYEFQKERLTVERIIEEYRSLCQYLFQFNPSLKIIFTVSPVRHLGDGFHENQLSKSILHLAIDSLVDNRSCFYFPSYEILMDDLRDYRFYARDFCHPDDEAVQYMIEKLTDTFFEEDTILRWKEIEKENRRKRHISLR